MTTETDPDANVIPELSALLTQWPPRSFFLTAGAGSGKTWTLTRLLQRLTGSPIKLTPGDTSAGPPTTGEKGLSERLRREGRTIGVITYTNVACDQIRAGLGQNPLAVVQTIHSFCWNLIEGFDADIRTVLQKEATAAVNDAETALRKADEELAKQRDRWAKAKTEHEKSATATAAKNLAAAVKAVAKAERTRTSKETALDRARERVAELALIERFTYNPDVGRAASGSLSHAQVLEIASTLLIERVTLRRVLVARHPLMLIDECQDTEQGVLAALKCVADSESGFAFGLIGDPRQRIYLTGAATLTDYLPQNHASLALRNNRRSGHRIVELINTIWDAKVHERGPSFPVVPQVPRPRAEAGHVRLFVGPSTHPDKPTAEHLIAERMAIVTKDQGWAAASPPGYLTLVLEHALAAARGGFGGLFGALRLHKGYVDRLKDELPADVRVFKIVESLVGTAPTQDPPSAGAVMDILQRQSQLLSPDAASPRSGAMKLSALTQAREGINALRSLWAGDADPRLGDIVKSLKSSRLLPLSEPLEDWAGNEGDGLNAGNDAPEPEPAQGDAEREDSKEETTNKADAVAAAMAQPWSQWTRLRAYFAHGAGAATHQGMKGAEHDRILAVLDDASVVGKLFAYDRFFGADLSESDRAKKAGEENSIDRTRRLLYVVCSRPRSSLAVVLWSSDPARARKFAESQGWFNADEIERIESPGLP